MTELHDLGAVAAAREIAGGRLSARELVSHLLKRAAGFRALNAFVTLDAERVLAAAAAADERQAAGLPLGALHGVPIAIKDNIETRDDPTTAGSNALRTYIAKADAPVVGRLKQAGALVFGKTGLHEFAFGVTSSNGAFGPIRNPFDPERSPGGSSGGSGAAVGARLAPAALGTDTGGSVRIPAAFCGIYGLRPTLARWPAAGVVPIARSRDTPGPMARAMADIALIDEAVTGEPAPMAAALAGLRIGVPASHFLDLDAEVERLARAALDRLVRAGCELVEIDLPDVWTLTRATQPIVFTEAREQLEAFFAARGRRLKDAVAEIASPDVARVFQALTSEPARVRHPGWERLLSALKGLFADTLGRERLAAIAYPVTPARAPRLDEDVSFLMNGRRVPTFETIIRHTDASAAAGVPALAIPIGRDSGGVPVGLELVSAPGADRALLALGLAVEREGFLAENCG